jgi:hypothetical protein
MPAVLVCTLALALWRALLAVCTLCDAHTPHIPSKISPDTICFWPSLAVPRKKEELQHTPNVPYTYILRVELQIVSFAFARLRGTRALLLLC